MPQFRRFVSSRDAAQRPRPGVIISGVRDDFSVDSSRYGLKPERIASALQAADSGDTLAMYEIFSAVEEDPHVLSVLSKRRRAVTSRRLVFDAPAVPEDQPGAEARAARGKEAADLCASVVLGDDERGGIQGWHQALYDLTDAIGFGYSLHQIVWGESRNAFVPLKLERWPQRDTILGDISDPFGQHADRVRIITAENQTQGEDLAPNQWVLHQHKSRSDALARAALLRSIMWWYLFKRFSAKDWAIFAERFGIPLRVGKYAPGTDDQGRKELKKAVIGLGKDAGAIMEEGTTIEFIESKISGSLPHEPLARFCDEQISKAILGNTLTTEVGSSGGNRALGEVQKEAETDMTDHDAAMIGTSIRWQLCAPIVRFNLGESYPVPVPRFLVDEEENELERAQADEIFVRSIGLPLAQSYFYQQYDRPAPIEGEPLVSPPAKKTTSGEDITDDATEGTEPADEAELEAERTANGIDAMHAGAIMAMNAEHGGARARRYIHALAVKKKSHRWAM